MSAKKRSNPSGSRAGGKGGDGGGERPRKGRASDLGRALRTVYDNTLRESVPDDFMDLLRKLN